MAFARPVDHAQPYYLPPANYEYATFNDSSAAAREQGLGSGNNSPPMAAGSSYHAGANHYMNDTVGYPTTSIGHQDPGTDAITASVTDRGATQFSGNFYHH